MSDPESPFHPRQSDRRSRLDRRWIKAQYQGPERRRGKERRSEIELKDLDKDLTVSEGVEAHKMAGLEKLLVSNTIQLEALTRVLLDKGVVQEEELLAMMQSVKSEYQRNSKS